MYGRPAIKLNNRSSPPDLGAAGPKRQLRHLVDFGQRRAQRMPDLHGVGAQYDHHLFAPLPHVVPDEVVRQEQELPAVQAQPDRVAQAQVQALREQACGGDCGEGLEKSRVVDVIQYRL